MSDTVIKYSDSFTNAPSRFHEVVGPDGHAPQFCLKRESFIGGDHDPFQNKTFASKKQQEIHAAKTGAIKMSGDEFMDWQDDLKANRKMLAKERKKKLDTDLLKGLAEASQA